MSGPKTATAPTGRLCPGTHPDRGGADARLELAARELDQVACPTSSSRFLTAGVNRSPSSVLTRSSGRPASIARPMALRSPGGAARCRAPRRAASAASRGARSRSRPHRRAPRARPTTAAPSRAGPGAPSRTGGPPGGTGPSRGTRSRSAAPPSRASTAPGPSARGRARSASAAGGAPPSGRGRWPRPAPPRSSSRRARSRASSSATARTTD